MKTLADYLAERPTKFIDTAAASIAVYSVAAAERGYVFLGVRPANIPTHMTPQEARRLANMLLRTADDIDHYRGKVASDQVKAEGGSAMDQARAHIATTFSGE